MKGPCSALKSFTCCLARRVVHVRPSVIYVHATRSEIYVAVPDTCTPYGFIAKHLSGIPPAGIVEFVE